MTNKIFGVLLVVSGLFILWRPDVLRGLGGFNQERWQYRLMAGVMLLIGILLFYTD